MGWQRPRSREGSPTEPEDFGSFANLPTSSSPEASQCVCIEKQQLPSPVTSPSLGTFMGHPGIKDYQEPQEGLHLAPLQKLQEPRTGYVSSPNGSTKALGSSKACCESEVTQSQLHAKHLTCQED